MSRVTRDLPVCVRSATARDLPAIVSLVRGLAKYERLTRYTRIDAKRLRRDGFGRHPAFRSLIAKRGTSPVGYAAYYFAYSTFTSAPVLFVEDIFVRPKERGRGAGKALMRALARIATRRGCEQMEWLVLDWNKPSIQFYTRLGARLDKTWVLTRLTGANLRRLARTRQ